MRRILSLSSPLFFANTDSEPDLEINCTVYVWHNLAALFAVCLPAFAAHATEVHWVQFQCKGPCNEYTHLLPGPALQSATC